MQIRIESPDQPELLALIDELDAYQKPLYPAESHHGIDLAALMAPAVRFAVARDGRGGVLGIGAVVLQPGFGEVKRMYVPPVHRGRGVARALLAVLEAEAGAAGAQSLMLETGIRQPEALALYERAGFVRCGPFADYAEDPLSVFMKKPLAP
jgi:putative acetyltransferase